MKRRSSTSEPPEPVFFTDRDLGPTVAALLERSGLRVEPYHRHFPSPTTPDAVWLRFVGERGWIAVTHDSRIRYQREELEALMLFGAKTFVIVGKAPHPVLAEAFVRNIRKIERLIRRQREPFVAKVFAGADEVSLWLTYEEWRRGREGS